MLNQTLQYLRYIKRLYVSLDVASQTFEWVSASISQFISSLCAINFMRVHTLEKIACFCPTIRKSHHLQWSLWWYYVLDHVTMFQVLQESIKGCVIHKFRSLEKKWHAFHAHTKQSAKLLNIMVELMLLSVQSWMKLTFGTSVKFC